MSGILLVICLTILKVYTNVTRCLVYVVQICFVEIVKIFEQAIMHDINKSRFVQWNVLKHLLHAEGENLYCIY